MGKVKEIGRGEISPFTRWDEIYFTSVNNIQYSGWPLQKHMKEDLTPYNPFKFVVLQAMAMRPILASPLATSCTLFAFTDCEFKSVKTTKNLILADKTVQILK